MSVWTVSQRFSHLQWRRLFKKFWVRSTTIADFGSSFRKILFPVTLVCCILCTISYGSNAMDQRSGDDWFSGWCFRHQQGDQMPNFEVLDVRDAQHWNWIESSINLTSGKESVWRNNRPRSRIVFFAEDRLLTWSSSTSGSVKSMILSRIMVTYSLLLFEMIFRNSIQSGTEFYCLWRKSHLTTFLKNCTNLEYESLRNSSPYWNCMILKIHQKKTRPDDYKLKTMMKRIIEQEIRNKNFGSRNGNFWEEHRDQESRNNSVYKEFLEIVGNGSPTGSVLMDIIAVSDTMLISVESYPIKSVSEFFHAAEWAKIIETPKSQG